MISWEGLLKGEIGSGNIVEIWHTPQADHDTIPPIPVGTAIKLQTTDGPPVKARVIGRIPAGIEIEIDGRRHTLKLADRFHQIVRGDVLSQNWQFE